MIAILLYKEPCRPGRSGYDNRGRWWAHCKSTWVRGYFAHGFYILQVFLTDFLPLLGVQVKLVEAFVQQLVGADHGLFKLGEFLGQLELLDVGEGPRRRSGGPDVRGCLEKFHVGQFYDKNTMGEG